jgi:hypothetical protein
MWNHVTLLEELPLEGEHAWPSFEEGEMADLVAFFLARL